MQTDRRVLKPSASARHIGASSARALAMAHDTQAMGAAFQMFTQAAEREPDAIAIDLAR